MKVKIIQCSDQLMWYLNRTNEVFEVKFIDSYGYWVREGGIYNAINFIKPNDCTILNDFCDPKGYKP